MAKRAVLLVVLIMAFVHPAAPPARAEDVPWDTVEATWGTCGGLVVGVPLESILFWHQAGAANVFFSQRTGVGTAGNLQYTQGEHDIAGPPDVNNQFGFALAAGDFDNNGYQDLVVGAIYDDVDETMDVGAVHIKYGTHHGFRDAQLVHQGGNGVQGTADGGDHFGFALATGDFNGDGHDDLAIGAPKDNILDTDDAGAVNVLYGSAAGVTGDGDHLWHMNKSHVQGTAASLDYFGRTLAAGDFNGDGHDDLAISAPFASTNTVSDAGTVHVLYGYARGMTADGNQLWHLDVVGVEGEAGTDGRYGWSLAAGDFDGDGHDDLAVGATMSDPEGVRDAGAVSVLYGSSVGLAVNGNKLWHQGIEGIEGTLEEDDWFGEALATGDFNGDGYDDLVVGTPMDETRGDSFAGQVNVIYGSSRGLAIGGSQLWHQDYPGLEGYTEFGANFGESLAAADLNGDGCCDLAIGAPGQTVNTTADAGTVTVIYGTAGGLDVVGSQYLHQAVDDVVGAPEEGDSFGRSLVAWSHPVGVVTLPAIRKP